MLTILVTVFIKVLHISENGHKLRHTHTHTHTHALTRTHRVYLLSLIHISIEPEHC